MGFDSGTVSFRRYAVIGSQPELIDQAILEKFAANALRTDGVGVSEIEYGWCGGRHVLDDVFSFENNVFADALHVAMRIDTNRVPHEIAKAYKLIEEDAAKKENPSGFISRNQKKIAGEIAQQQIDEELRRGVYRRSKLVPLLWDLPSASIYGNFSDTAEEKLHELFERTFGLTLERLSSGSQGRRWMEAHGRRRDYEDVRPSRFVSRGESDQLAEYPWVAKGPEAKDFLGNEYLMWLWHQSFIHEGAVKTESGEVVVFFDRMLDLDCAFGESGRDLLRSTAVARMPEAVEALRSGKAPRKVGMIVESQGMQYSFTLAAETLAVSTLKLPEVPEADTPRVLFEERIAMIRDFAKLLDSLYAAFLKVRSSSGWEGQVSSIRKWIAQTARMEHAIA